MVSIANADLVLTVNGLDTSKPIEVEGHDDIIIGVVGQTDEQKEGYSVTCEMGGKLEPLPEPNTLAEKPKEGDYLFTFEDEELGMAIVNLTVGDVLDYQLILFNVPDANTVIFGIDSDAIEIPEPEPETEAELLSAEVDNTESMAGETMQESDMQGSEPGGVMASATSGYDVVLSGVNEYTTPRSYSNQSVLVTEDGFVAYDNVYFENCTVDVNGFIELNSDVNLVDSTINVLGGLKAKAGIVIMETGASSIIASGDSLNAGRITLEGRFANPIRVYSDYAATDAEFIIIESESSSNSTIKWVDFFGGWTNVQIYDKRLTEGIKNCRFFGANYAVYQNGVEELTDVRFCFFYWNTISVYLGIDDCYANEVEFLLDNVVIDNNFESSSFGIVLSGYQSVPDYSTLRISNSVITNSYCGWFIDGSSFYPPVMSNLAYYGNYYDDNLSSSGFQKNPMYLPQRPFITPSDPNGWPYFIEPNSAVADVNIGDLWQSAPQQLLTSIYEDGTPRGNKGIGFGMPISLSYVTKVGELACDIISDGIVNLKDFAEFAADWGAASAGSPADFDDDGTVDVNDLDMLSQNWLQTSYIEPNVTDNGDYLTLTCQEANDVNLTDFAFFLDGEFIALRDIDEYPTFLVDKMKNKGGVHTIKAVIKGDHSKPYATTGKAVSFDTPLSGINFQELFDPCNYFVLQGDVAGGYTADINITDFDSNILWSDQFSDDFTCLIDPSTFSDEINYTVAYSTSGSSGSGSALALGGKPTMKTSGLVICMLANGMTEGSNYTDTGTCRYAAKMWKGNGVTPITLLGFGEHNQVNFEMLKKVFYKYRNIRYMHINSHGHCETDGAGFFGFDVPRTRFRFNDGDWPSHNSRIWTDKGLDVPEGYEYLSKSLEKHYCLAHFPFKYDQLRIVVLEPCYALRNIATEDAQKLVHYVDGAYQWEVDNNQNAHYQYTYSDVCFAFNVRSSKQMILGSGELVVKGSIYPYFTRFINAFWYGLGAENLSVYNALMDWAIPNANMQVMKEFRTRGAGIQTDIYLKPNP